MILDTSALLAIVFKEEHAEWVLSQLEQHPHPLSMSTVNLTEFLILVKDRRPHAYDSVREQVLSSSIDFVPPDIKQSEIAAEARLKFPINLGDCFAYALAKQLKRPILTLDQEFRKTDVEVCLPKRDAIKS